MLNVSIKSKIEDSLSDTYIDQVSPDGDSLKKILSLSGYELNALDDSIVTQYIYTLTQYLVFLQVQTNVRQIKYLDTKRQYELALSKAIANTSGKTIKERSKLALIENDAVQKLEQSFKVAEADYILFTKIPDSILELINAFKKELSIRIK